MPTRSQITFTVLLILLAGLYAVWLLFPITIITADIGRHIMDGKVFFAHPELRSALLSTNFYSQAAPEYSIINHHWAAGIIYAQVLNIFGWKGVHILQILLGLSALGFIFDMARRRSSAGIAFVAAICLLPLIAYRHEVRPEYFGYAFLGGIFWILEAVSSHRIRPAWLWVAPVLIMFWVNLHASFPLGIGLIFLFTLRAFLQKNPLKNTLAFIMGLSALATFINPSGIAGALYPLSILRDPGYAVFENQSIAFLQSIGAMNTTFIFTYVCAVLLALAIGTLAYAKKLSDMLPHTIIASLALLMALLAVRHITLLGLLLLPVFAAAMGVSAKRLPRRAALSVAIVIAMVAVGLQINHLRSRWIVLGLEPTANDAAQFMKQQEISGPYFNNFDIGGYMIYHFFPEEKPFAYNRPESHPSDFWRSVYIPMMQDSAVWQQQLSKHRFNAIVLFHGDRTQWAQDFLVSRIRDPEWAAVFVDRSVIVFVRQNGLNADVIRQFAIPSEQLLKN